MRFKHGFIDRVLDSTNIEDIIREDYELKKKGSNYFCNCPVHNERTGSFVVSPARNMYKCFGCGISGNAITYLTKIRGFSFVEAIKHLANKSGIPVEEEDGEELTQEEREKEQKLQVMKIVADKVAEYFREQLFADTPAAKEALAYATKRWGIEYVKQANMGYDPGNASLIHWAKETGFSVEILIELGLIKENDNGKLYNFFYKRLIFPICSKSNQVIGYTARILKDGQPKYLNSPDSLLYKKGESIFGLNVAYRTGGAEGILYLVEGAADVYRLNVIGINNAVAPLGTAWTTVQFEILSRITDTLCFIPDIDIPKGNDKYGAGIKSVIKNGKVAIAKGFKVLVKIIPEDKDGKRDCDSYFDTKKKFDGISKDDFILWYSQLLLSDKDTYAESSGSMQEIAEIIAKVKDKEYTRIIIKQVARLFHVSISILEDTVNRNVRKAVEAKRFSSENMMDRELYIEFGFYEKNNCYFSLGSDNVETRWSTFKMEPLFHIEDQMNAKRLFKVTNIRGISKIIELNQKDLISLQNFKLRMESIGYFIWEAKEEQLIKLKNYLYEKTETAAEITQLGWNDKGFFAFGNGIIYNGKWVQVDQFGIVRLDIGNFYLPAASKIFANERNLFQFERKFVHLGLNEISLRKFADKFVEVFGNNAKIGICFLLATLFKDIIVAKTKNFPILDLFGPKGSGKSEMGHTLMSFFIINNDPPNLSSATDAALADAVAQCANALVHIDEYKNTIELSRREFIKGLYDGVGRTRMNMDRDKKRETTAVDSGIILSGQELPTIDIAIFSRMIYLTFNTSEFSISSKRKFDELKQIRDCGLSHLVIQILKYRKRVESEFGINYQSAFSDIFSSVEKLSIEDRIFRNWVTILAVYRTLSGCIDLGFDYRDMLNVCIEGIKAQNSVCKSNNELAYFWQAVDFLHQNGDIFIDSDYKIRYESSLKCKESRDKQIFAEPKPILYLRFKRIVTLYRQLAKKNGDPAIPQDSLRHYLEVSKEYLGLKNAVRFRNLCNATENAKTVVDSAGRQSVTNASAIDWALCFDYKALSENYNISLEVSDYVEDI